MFLQDFRRLLGILRLDCDNSDVIFLQASTSSARVLWIAFDSRANLNDAHYFQTESIREISQRIMHGDQVFVLFVLERRLAMGVKFLQSL